MKKTLILAVLSSFAIFAGCKKGCTDKDAENYNSSAKKDNATCMFATKVAFWYDQQTSRALIQDGATSLTYFVDGQIIGSSATNVYWNFQPVCDQTGVVSIVKELGKNRSGTFTYKVIDQTGFVYWENTGSFSANTCNPIQLTF